MDFALSPAIADAVTKAARSLRAHCVVGCACYGFEVLGNRLLPERLWLRYTHADARDPDHPQTRVCYVAFDRATGQVLPDREHRAPEYGATDPDSLRRLQGATFIQMTLPDGF